MEVNRMLIESLLGGEHLKAARMLGIVKEKKLVFEDQEESSSFFDFAFRELRRDGKSPIEHLLLKNASLNKYQLEYLKGLVRPSVSLFEVMNADGKNGVLQLQDLLFPKHGNLELYDMGFSSTGAPGLLIFTVAVPVFDAFITSGVAFTFDEKWKDFLLRKSLYRFFGKEINDSAKRFKIFFHLNREIGNEVHFQ